MNPRVFLPETASFTHRFLDGVGCGTGPVTRWLPFAGLPLPGRRLGWRGRRGPAIHACLAWQSSRPGNPRGATLARGGAGCYQQLKSLPFVADRQPRTCSPTAGQTAFQPFRTPRPVLPPPPPGAAARGSSSSTTATPAA